jgi:uncharacterized membrane protein
MIRPGVMGGAMASDPMRFHTPHLHLHSAFGSDAFGKKAEAFARFFGTPAFLIGQSVIVAIWIAVNVIGMTKAWDPYPFILLNLMFSLQAAYAAPLILLAQTRQADREKMLSEADAQHREALAQASIERNEIAVQQGKTLHELLVSNTKLTEETAKLTEQVDSLTRQIHEKICAGK